MQKSNNRSLLKNTMALYFRMGFLMIITLFSSRIVLRELGVVDYGIYNVVSSVVAIFAFITTAVTDTTCRYLSFYIGRDDLKSTIDIFQISLSLVLVVAAGVFFLGEGLGYWFIKTQLVIPVERLNVSLLVFHVLLLEASIFIFQMPFSSLLMAYDHMTLYAIIEVLYAVVKLCAIYSLAFIPVDSLLMYALFLLLLRILLLSVYVIISVRKISACRIGFNWHFDSWKPLLRFSSWEMFRQFSVTMRTHGTNFLLNVFFGPVINAAYGISIVVLGACQQLYTSVLTAVKFHFFRAYASNDFTRLVYLYTRSMVLSFALLLIVLLPFFFNVEYVLNLWLGSHPPMSVIFTRYVLVLTVITNFMLVQLYVVQATAKIKIPSILSGLIVLLTIPISYFALKYYSVASSVFVITILLASISCLVYSVFVHKYIPGITRKVIATNILFPIFSLLGIALIPMLLLELSSITGFIKILISLVAMLLIIPTTCYFSVLNKLERKAILERFGLSRLL